MRIAVVDDESAWREKIENYLRKIVNTQDDIDLFVSGEKFLEKSEKYDIVFMDVEMDKTDGFETTKIYKEKYPGAVVAMLTTHNEMCSQGYMIEAFRYISKTDMYKGIQETLFSLQKILRNNKTIEIHVLSQGEYQVDINNIIYVETHGRNTLVHMRGKDYICTDSMKEMSEKLEKEAFFKCHQSFLVNIDEVNDYSREDVFLKSGEKIMLSKRQRKAFEDAFFKRTFQCANR